MGSTRCRDDEGTEPRDGSALVLAAVFLLLAVLVGLRTGDTSMDVDEVVFRQTLESMRSGDGYYESFEDALIDKEGVAPSNPRAYRPPGLYLALSVVPDGALRYVVAIPFAVLLLAAWRIGRPSGAWGGSVSVVFVGLWAVGAAPYLYLHAEVWGAALLMAGLALSRERRGAAGLVLAAAVAIRELFAPAFLVGLLLNRRSWVWWASLGGLVVVGAVHLQMASGFLDPDGYQPPLRFSGDYLQAIGPGDEWFGAVVGVVGGLLGMVGCVLGWRAKDQAARIALGHNIVLAVLTVTSGRTYWGFVFGPSTAVFAAVAIDRFRRRRRHSGEPRDERTPVLAT